MDCKHETTVDEIQNREHPVIQLDIVFATAGNAVLLLLDTWTVLFCNIDEEEECQNRGRIVE